MFSNAENRQLKADLPWALLDAAKSSLSKNVRTRLYASTGAGEEESVIRYLLHVFVDTGTKIPAALHAQLSVWAIGYRGSDTGEELTSLIGRVCIGDPSPTPAQTLLATSLSG